MLQHSTSYMTHSFTRVLFNPSLFVYTIDVMPVRTPCTLFRGQITLALDHLFKLLHFHEMILTLYEYLSWQLVQAAQILVGEFLTDFN